jgi:hypothetical protein
MVGPAAKREGVAHLQAVLGLSERRACFIVGADRKMIRYRSRRPVETELRARLRVLANERRRSGYRRLSEDDQGRSGLRVYQLGPLWAYAKGVTLDFSRPANLPTTPSSRHSTAACAPSA